MTECDALILGSGQGGNALAGYLAKKGKKVVLVEKVQLGGTCVNTGCTPSKALYEAVRKIHHGRNVQYAGFTINKSELDFKKLMRYARGLARDSRQSMEESFADLGNLNVVYGHGRFIDNKTLRVSYPDAKSSDFRAEQIFINTGAEPRIPPIKGLEKLSYYTSLNIWELEQLPKKLLILGGGYVGLEFAQNFARLGSQVTVIGDSAKIIGREDDDIIAAVQEMLEGEGITFALNAEVSEARQSGDGVLLKLSDGREIKGDALLLATGRRPTTKDIGLENTSINQDEKGAIVVNDWLETGVEGVFALGEVAGSPQFTHISYDDFRIIRDRLFENGQRSRKGRQVPYTLFIDPELAAFGIKEKEAKEQGLNYKCHELNMSSFSRASEKNEVHGKAKVICDQEGYIMGATVFGVEGGELLSLLQVAASGGVKASDLREFIFAHPLLAEGINNLFA